MRYRPFSHFNISVSAISLALNDADRSRSAEQWTRLIYAALEEGINSFEVQGRQPALIDGLTRALSQVERRLIFVSWRIGPATIPPQFAAQAFEPDMIQASVQSALTRTGLGYIDLLLLDDPGERDLPPQSLALLKQLKSRGQVRLIGVAGENAAIDAYISTRQFDCLAEPFNLLSGWRERLRVRAAQERDMAVIGYDFCPATLLLPPGAAAAKRRLWRRKPVATAPRAYDFLSHTPGWSREEICLAFALTEPSIATVQVSPDSVEALKSYCAATDREMPAGLGAQIEMARVNALGDPAVQQAGA
jgi:aryl-alcohol dehydrogenase-like predicted oxidoreductase